MKRRRAVILTAITLGSLAMPLAMATEAFADTVGPTRSVTDPVPLVIAHRGFSADMPENTIPAMIGAAAAGADKAEIDVQRTKDHALVVIHDKTFARTTNVGRVFPGRANDPISSFTLAQVERLDAGSWKGQQFTGTKVPTLARLLRAIAPTHMNLLLELKNPDLYPGYERQVAATLADSGFTSAHRVDVHSFSALALKEFHRYAPTVPIGLITKNGVGHVSSEQWLQTVNPTAGSVNDAAIDRAQADHLAVFTWPGSPGQDSSSGIAREIANGVSGIITNHPDVALAQIKALPPVQSQSSGAAATPAGQPGPTSAG